MESQKNLSPIINFIWTVADDVLVHAYKKGKYGDVILPMTVIRRLDLVLEPTKDKVLKSYNEYKDRLDNLDFLLTSEKDGSGKQFYNTSKFTLKSLLDDPKNIRTNFEAYLDGFSPNVQDIISKFKFRNQLDTLENDEDDIHLLFQLIEKFVSPKIDLHPDRLTNHQMGYVFEDLVRRFNEENNEEAGEHFTPREIIELMANIVFLPIKDKLRQGSYLVYDPCSGSGGMLTEARNFINSVIGSDAVVHLYGQEVQAETYATSKSDLLIKGDDPEKLGFGSTLTNDKFADIKFDFMMTNPPYGKSWKDDKKKLGVGPKGAILDPRFQIGIPRINDGQLMFVQHMLSKMKDTPLGSRIASVHNGSALFTGDAGQGESEIRKYLIENDLLEAVIALPADLFYNTPIPTYIMFISNRKHPSRQGKVQLINATSSNFYKLMKRTLGKKRVELLPEHVAKIVDLYQDRNDNSHSKIIKNEDLGYLLVPVRTPLMGENNLPLIDSKGRPKVDKSRKDAEKVPLGTNVEEYFATEVLPFLPNAWFNPDEIKIGYEINFNQHFHAFKNRRDVSEIISDLEGIEKQSEDLIESISKQKDKSISTDQVSRIHSGIPYMPNIPSSWKSIKIKYLLAERNERSETGGEELLALSKYDGVIPKNSLEERTGGAESLIGYKKVFKDDLVFNKMQAVNGLISVSEIEGITSPDYAIYYSINPELNIRYLSYILTQNEYSALLKKVSKGVMEGYIRVYTDSFFSLKVPLPPRSVQDEILECIDLESKKIKSALETAKKQIDIIKEYEQVIKADYISGKRSTGTSL
jgi:type I restriction enzyme M protein